MFPKFFPIKLTFFTAVVLITLPVIAHNIEVSGDVAATFHIEPNHNPKAGKESTAWFALTKKGGEIIPLEECDCALSVRANPHEEESKPLMEPPLKPLTVEKYQNIPSATIIFPQPGSYELELEGKPQNGADFQPFSFSYTINVSL